MPSPPPPSTPPELPSAALTEPATPAAGMRRSVGPAISTIACTALDTPGFPRWRPSRASWANASKSARWPPAREETETQRQAAPTDKYAYARPYPLIY